MRRTHSARLFLSHAHSDTGASTITVCQIRSLCEAAVRGFDRWQECDGNLVGMSLASDLHMHALSEQSLYFSCMTLAFQPPPPQFPQRYLNTLSAQLFTLLPAPSLSPFHSHTHATVSYCLKLLESFVLEEPLTGPGGRRLGAHRQIIRIDSAHKRGGGRCFEKASDYSGEQRRSVHSLHMVTLTPALACNADMNTCLCVHIHTGVNKSPQWKGKRANVSHMSAGIVGDDFHVAAY